MGFYKVQFPDGAEVEFSAKGLGFGDTSRIHSIVGPDFRARGRSCRRMKSCGRGGIAGSACLSKLEKALQDLPPDIVANFRPVILSNSAELQRNSLKRAAAAWLGFLRG